MRLFVPYQPRPNQTTYKHASAGRTKNATALFEEVEFQTDLTSFGIGRVITVYPTTDEVKVLDDDGVEWTGPTDLVSPINE